MYNDDNFLEYAKFIYNNVQCNNIKEFRSDMARFGLLSKLLNRFEAGEKESIRLITNHVIILHNVFGRYATEFLFFKIDKSFHKIIASVLIFLNRLPDDMEKEYDENVLEMLKDL